MTPADAGLTAVAELQINDRPEAAGSIARLHLAVTFIGFAVIESGTEAMTAARTAKAGYFGHGEVGRDVDVAVLFRFSHHSLRFFDGQLFTVRSHAHGFVVKAPPHAAYGAFAHSPGFAAAASVLAPGSADSFSPGEYLVHILIPEDILGFQIGAGPEGLGRGNDTVNGVPGGLQTQQPLIHNPVLVVSSSVKVHPQLIEFFHRDSGRGHLRKRRAQIRPGVNLTFSPADPTPLRQVIDG